MRTGKAFRVLDTLSGKDVFIRNANSVALAANLEPKTADKWLRIFEHLGYVERVSAATVGDQYANRFYAPAFSPRELRSPIIRVQIRDAIENLSEEEVEKCLQ